MVKQLRDVKDMESRVARGEYFGDFVIVAGVPYQIVEYSLESYGRGSRWITFYNPFTKKQFYIDYAEKTVDFEKSIVAWEKDLSLDMVWLKKRFKI